MPECGVQPELPGETAVIVEEIKEYEWLDKLAEVGWAHQTGDRPLPPTPSAPGDLSDRTLGDSCRDGHGGILPVSGMR